MIRGLAAIGVVALAFGLASQRVLNEWTSRGWTLDSIQFAMRDSSKRPAMAFISFTREDANES